jgi:hypothetical protein
LVGEQEITGGGKTAEAYLLILMMVALAVVVEIMVAVTQEELVPQVKGLTEVAAPHIQVLVVHLLAVAVEEQVVEAVTLPVELVGMAV